MVNPTRVPLDDRCELDRGHLHVRKVSGDADAPVDRVGEDLRRARQCIGEDLADISRVLKIRPYYLIAVEESRFEALPGRVYAIGFVRSYAAYLGLDAGNFVNRLKSEMDGDAGGKEPEADGLLPVPERKSPQGS